MTIIDQIEELVSALDKRGEEISPFLHLGPGSYDELHKHARANMKNPYASIGNGHVTLIIHTSVGQVAILRTNRKCDSYVGMNGTTLLDIIAERELLGL